MSEKLMLDLPKTTEFNKRIPKQRFYEHLSITPKLKQCFVNQIKSIVWRNKIASTTMNIAAGKEVLELEVFEIHLNGEELDKNVLLQIDREIPYHILFILVYNGKYQAWIGYKEATSSGSSAFKVSRYYHTEWLGLSEPVLRFEGLDTDAVYENLVRQIGNDELPSGNNETLKETVGRNEQREKLVKRINTLQAKVRKEKQFNRQVQMNNELKELKSELEKM
ncbi:MAG: DUF4391 domain-containing protein [Alistipes senegalensis]|nr:DUF4391 domain-containing protein [Oxalobacter formigenes]MCM1281692.1 DUF4391 domain-containing protein [Alistipes senegalensis]